MLKHITLRHTHFLLTIPLLILLGYLLQSTVWTTYPSKTLLLLESFSIFMGAMIFVLLWYSYDKVPDSYHILGFMYLIISLLYAAHIQFYDSYSGTTDDLSLGLVMTGRIIEALAFLSITFKIPFRLNKYLALFLSLLVGGAIIAKVIGLHDFLPALYDTSGYTSTKAGLEVVILLILFINIYFLRKNVNTKDIIANNMIFAALLIDVVLTVFFLIQKGPNTTWSILGHLFRVTFYLHLFKGIFVNAITYPYEKLEEVLNHLPLAVATYDHNQKLTFANNQFKTIVGLSFADVNGLSQKQIIDKMFKHQAPEQLEADLRICNEVQQKIVTIKNQQDKLVKIVVDVYKLQSGGSLCIFDTANKIQEIQNLRLQTQTILNSLHNFVVIIDVNMTVIMCNKAFCESVEMNAQDLIGLTTSELTKKISFSLPDIVLHSIDSTILENAQEVSIITPSGKSKDWLIQLASIKNLNNEVIGSICVGSDISNLKKEQAEAHQQEKLMLLGQMATGIVHEIRNPITAMMGFIQLLNMKVQDQELREYCHYIEKEADDLNRIVTDYLQFARPTAPIFKPVSPNSIVEDLKHIIDMNLFTQVIKFNYSLQPNIPLINADESKIKQVILNIVKNAVDAVNAVENPEIIIKTNYDPAIHETYISITNNGKIMTLEEKQNSSTPFYTTKTKGTGLGLSICNQIIAEHKGSINITSDINCGTTFEIVFPEVEVTEDTEVI